MSCTACTKSYGLFTKEVGCPNCGYSFCSKCLKKTAEVPRKNNAVLNVCLKCYEILERQKLSDDAYGNQRTDKLHRHEGLPSKISINEVLDIPETDLTAGNLLEPLKPITNAEEAEPDNDNDNINDNLDSVISKKLKNLREAHLDDMELPSDKDMAVRLAGLKGQPYKEYNKKDLLSTDKRTDQQKTQDLIKQFLEENEIDEAAAGTAVDPIADIERRLKALKGEGGFPMSAAQVDKIKDIPENEDATANKIVEKFLNEAQLPDTDLTVEEKEFLESIPRPPSAKDNEQLPWCTICNEDAVVRCLGCGGDLYCLGCFKECHDDDEDFRRHRTTPFEMPPNFKEDHF